jgi:hypothetical protein
LNNNAWPYFVLQKSRLSGFLSLNISSNNDKFDASFGYMKSSKRNLLRNENGCIFLEAL